ncbi:MAG: glycosyltransferase family 2 protein [Candidatus Woesearchaeota archaeon]|nr:MAG: glycosyltransferase family 2 protein [Candidatus Woesearchaeota archaeon]
MQIELIPKDPVLLIGAILFFFMFIQILIGFFSFLIFLFKKTKQPPKILPPLSVLIPAYNEEVVIEKTLKAVFAATYPREKLQVICIDDASTDNTLSLMKKFPVHILQTTHAGKSAALNKALSLAKHDIVITLDADVFVDKNFFKEIIGPFQDKKVGAVNGMIFIEDSTRPLGTFQRVEYWFHNIIRASLSSVFENTLWFFGAAAAYRKEALLKVKGFSEEVLTEDMDIALKLVQKSYKVVAAPRAYYYSVAMESFKSIFSQRMRWFIGGPQCALKNLGAFRLSNVPLLLFFFQQVYWAIFSFAMIPLVIYEVMYWLPDAGIGAYLFRWFSFAGPVYVFYNIPNWGISTASIFGVTAGILTPLLCLGGAAYFKQKVTLRDMISLFFYFPYTLLLNVITIVGVIKYTFSKKRTFIR